MAQSSQLGLSRQQIKNLRFRDLYLSGSTIDLGGTKISRDAASGGITIANANGGTVDSRVKNLFADGTITASNLNIIGDYVTMQTTTSNTEMMVIENAGTGPALKVTQTGVNSIAEFYDDGGVLALKIADGGNVGIGTSAPLQKLDVIGTVQATGFSGNGALVTSLNVDNVSAGNLAVARGGTNIQSYTVGDLIYATGDTALSKLADVATGNALISGGVGVVPAWGKIGLTTHVSGTLGVANGGTGAASLTANKVLVGNGTTGVLQPTNLHWDDANSRLGIGIATPQAAQHISSGDQSITRYGPNASWSTDLCIGSGTSQINTTTAQCITTNGNLHLDSSSTSGRALSFNYYANAAGTTTTNPIYSYGNWVHYGYMNLSMQPAFSVWKDDGLVSSAGAIVWNRVEVNVSNSYSASTGRFTAPIAGRYMFCIQGMTHSAVTGWMQIVKNDTVRLNGFNPYGPNTTYSPTSGTTIAQLAVNDFVDVRSVNSSMYSVGNGHNQFCGFLIG